MNMFSCPAGGWAGLGHAVRGVAAPKLIVEGPKSLPVFVQENGEHRKLATGETLVW